MTPEARSSGGWPELAERLRSAAGLAEQSARGAPLGAAEGLIAGLREIVVCMELAEQLYRSGSREGIEQFQQELERWAAAVPGLQAWVGASAALAAGWAAAAGIGAGYSPGDPATSARKAGAASEAG